MNLSKMNSSGVYDFSGFANCQKFEISSTIRLPEECDSIGLIASSGRNYGIQNKCYINSHISILNDKDLYLYIGLGDIKQSGYTVVVNSNFEIVIPMINNIGLISLNGFVKLYY